MLLSSNHLEYFNIVPSLIYSFFFRNFEILKVDSNNIVVILVFIVVVVVVTVVVVTQWKISLDSKLLFIIVV